MRFTFALILVFLGLVAANELRFLLTDEPEGLLRQKFIYEILIRVEDPLEFEEWTQHGKTLNVDQSLYEKYDHWMVEFYESFQRGALLPKGEFFGELVLSHMQQTKGLLHFLLYAKDWETFQQNVCWARINVNEGMFVYALSLAAFHIRDWALDIPAVHEIFPQHFFNSKFIYQGEKFNYDSWQKLSTSEQEIYNSNDTQQLNKWQWWKWMGLKQRWYLAEQIVGATDEHHVREIPEYREIMRDNKKFFMPVGYTHDIKVWNKESKLSYFTEDVTWSDNWYRFNLKTSVLLPIAYRLDRNLIWLEELQKYWARYNLERLSIGLGEIDDLARSYSYKIRTGYNPQMITWNDLPFLQRPNNFDWYEVSDSIKLKLSSTIENFLSTFKTKNARGASGGIIDMTSLEGYMYFAQLLHGDTELLNGNFSESFLPIVMMCNGQLEFDEFNDVYPHVLLNFETMLRDPLAYVIFKTKFLDYLRQYQKTLTLDKREPSPLESVKIVDVQFSELVTKFKYVDFDVSNLLNEKMDFVDGQYQWKHTLLARQMRLADTPFEYNITVDSAKEQLVMVHVFLGPKYDEYGGVPTLNENRFNFIKLDAFSVVLQKGKNFKTFQYGSGDMLDFSKLTFTEKYYTSLHILEHKQRNMPSKLYHRRPSSWTLPKGTPQGYPVQMIFIIENDMNVELFPFDREIDDSKFLVPNVFLKDVKIYHEDSLEKNYKDYTNYGHFDYERF